MITKLYCRTRSPGESALAVSPGCGSTATSMVRKPPPLLAPDSCSPVVVYTHRMDTTTLGSRINRSIASASTLLSDTSASDRKNWGLYWES